MANPKDSFAVILSEPFGFAQGDRLRFLLIHLSILNDGLILCF
jgi:hypothetical protein